MFSISADEFVVEDQTEREINIPEFLAPNRCLHSTRISECDESIQGCFETLRPHCPLPEGPLDSTLNTIVDEPFSTDVMLRKISQGESWANILTPYVVDSLKRYHSLRDVISVLADVFDSDVPDITKQVFEKLDDRLTRRLLLVQTIENLSYDTQRFLANFIRKNDLPIPFSYKLWNVDERSME